MTLSELRFAVTVANERNFRRAAEKCFVTQPALSLAIKKLEEELGVTLFERSHKDIAMTPIGERVIEQAIRTLEEANRVKEIARQGGNQLVGPLRLGVIYSVGPYLLPEIIPILRETAPDMPLMVGENLTEQIEVQLKNGQLDVAIIALPFDIPGVELMPLYDEAFKVAVPTVHPWSTRKSIQAEELAEEKVLMLNSGHCFSNQVMMACPSLNNKGEILQGNSLETIRNMVASNLGITVLPASATMDRYDSPLIKVIPFAKPIPIRRIALAWRKSYPRDQAIEAIASAVKQLESPAIKALS